MEEAIEKSAMRKVYMRLLPFAILSYFLAYIDRINVEFRRADDARRSRYVGHCLRVRPWHLLLGLLHLRGAEQPDHGKGGRAVVDRPHHDHLGPFGRRYRLGYRVDELCRRAVPAGCGRGRVLPGDHTVFHLLVSESPLCPHRFGLFDRTADRGGWQRADLDGASGSGRLARPAWLADYVHCRGGSDTTDRRRHAVSADRQAGTSKVSYGGREDLARCEAGKRAESQGCRADLQPVAGNVRS